MDDTNNALRVNVVAGGAGDGAILDGVSSAIKATVLDYTNSNPLAVRLSDTNGDYVGAGAGTEYTEDAAAAADPIGKATILVRKDTPATITSTDGDNVAQRGTNYGAAYVQVVTSAGSYVDTFGGGTQYTEDVAAAADPVGTMAIAVRADSRGTVVSAEGDNIALRADNAGQLYTASLDKISTGTINATGAVDISIVDGMSTLVFWMTGTLNGSATFDFYLSMNGTDFEPCEGFSIPLQSMVTISGDTKTALADNQYYFQIAGQKTFRIDVLGVTSGSVDYVVRQSQGSSIQLCPQMGIPVNIVDDAGFMFARSQQVGAFNLAYNAGSTNWERARTVQNGLNSTGTGILAAGLVGQFDNTTPTTITENSFGNLRISSNRNLFSTIRDAAGNERGANVDATNRLSVSVDNTATVSGSGTFTTADNQTITDNAAFTDGTSKVFTAGFIYDEVAGTALTENDAAAGRINVNRAVVQAIEDGATRGRYATVTASNAVKVDGSAVTQPVSGTVTANLAAGANNIGDVDVLTVPAPLSTTGNGTAATALRVTVASDSTGTIAATQSGTWTVQPGNTANTTAWLVREHTVSSAAVTSVAGSAASVSLLASNANRRKATFYNDSTAALYLKCGTTASTSSFTIKLFPAAFFELPAPVYTGAIDGIWDSAAGNVRITEFT
jgi:hypothetical protein